MKIIALLFGTAIILVSCVHTSKLSSDEVRTSTITLHEGEWISNFKNEVFLRCFNKLLPAGFNASLDSIDASSSANFEHLDYDQQILSTIDSIATSFSKRNETNWTIEQRKVTINICLGFRNSAELDSLAWKFYKKYSKDRLNNYKRSN